MQLSVQIEPEGDFIARLIPLRAAELFYNVNPPAAGFEIADGPFFHAHGGFVESFSLITDADKKLALIFSDTYIDDFLRVPAVAMFHRVCKGLVDHKIQLIRGEIDRGAVPGDDADNLLDDSFPGIFQRRIGPGMDFSTMLFHVKPWGRVIRDGEI